MKEKFVKHSLSLPVDFFCSENFLTNRLVGFPDPLPSASEIQLSPPLITLTCLIDRSEKHFELVSKEKALNPKVSSQPKTNKETFFRNNSEALLQSNRSSNPSGITDSYFLIEEALDDDRRLFIILLFYLEKFSCLDEIEKNIGELEKATQTGNVDKLKEMARNCRDECVNCEIPEALPALFVLEQVNQYSELVIARTLINLVKTAHKNFKARLVKKLSEIAEKRQKILQLKASFIED